ncbi:hypothetical protein DVG79_13325 [Exiguobacterium sp. RIT594]|nr:hypothetical protein DVG79_13325 [Exiguobacterium sp. RIT594]
MGKSEKISLIKTAWIVHGFRVSIQAVFLSKSDENTPTSKRSGRGASASGDESSSGKACLATRQLSDTLGLKTIKIRNKKIVMFFEN